MPAFGTPQAGSPFSTHSESSEQNYLQQAAGLFGRVKKVYHNFKEKREVQEELARLESELASLTTPVRQAMLALGRAIWMSSPDDAIALDSGSGLQDASAAFESAQHDLDQAEGKLNEAKQQQADARAAWSERLRDAKKALEAVEQACRSAQSDAEAAKMGLRQSIEKCLKPVLEAANESKAIIARPLGAEPPIAEAVLTVSEAAENAARVVRETIAELAEPEAACRGAVSRAAAAKADLEQAQRDMAGLQKESNESEVSLTNRIKENESRVASVRAQVRAAKEKLDEYCVRVGRAAVDSGNSGLLAAGGAAAANATSLSRRDFDLRCRIDELRSRLADLQ